MTVEEACNRNKVFQKLPPEVFQKLVSMATLKTYEKKETLYREREDLSRIYVVVFGYVALYRLNRNHDRKIIFICGSDSILNESVLERPLASHSCTALSAVTVLTFPREPLLELMLSDASLTHLILSSLSHKERRLCHQLANTSNMMRLDRQIAAKLWKLGRDFGKENDAGIEIVFDMSVTLLADMVGSTRESTSRILRQFSADGILSTQKNRFTIHDIDRLKTIVATTKD